MANTTQQPSKAVYNLLYLAAKLLNFNMGRIYSMLDLE